MLMGGNSGVGPEVVNVTPHFVGVAWACRC